MTTALKSRADRGAPESSHGVAIDSARTNGRARNLLPGYELYVQGGRAYGHAIDGWLNAEAEIVHGHSSWDSKHSVTLKGRNIMLSRAYCINPSAFVAACR